MALSDADWQKSKWTDEFVWFYIFSDYNLVKIKSFKGIGF